LLRNFENAPNKYQILIRELDNLCIVYNEAMDFYSDVLNQTTIKNLEHLAENKEWFNDWSRVWYNDTIIGYFKNDPHYKNQLGLYHQYTNTMLCLSSFYKNEAIDMYNKISKLLKSKETPPRTY